MFNGLIAVENESGLILALVIQDLAPIAEESMLAGAILEFKGSIQYIRKRAFIEVISKKNTLNNKFCVKRHFFS